MKKKIAIIIISICIILLVIAGGYLVDYIRTPKAIHEFSGLPLDGVNKLMIVAHPDDEMIWGGGELIKDDYLVVCITCGTDSKRVKEFVAVMEKTNDKYIMLGYPDKTNGKRDDWSTVRKNITDDLTQIINLKDWDVIVTHNPLGEYGHIHHKMTNYIVTANVHDKSKLYYFGKYYSKKNSANNKLTARKIDEDLLEKKIEILKLYKTQDFIMYTFDQMFEYENWISYDEWKAEY